MAPLVRCLSRVGSQVARATTNRAHHGACQRPGSLGSHPFASVSVVGGGSRSTFSPKVASTEGRQRMKSSMRAQAAAATIEVGDKLPDGKFSYFDAEGTMKEITVQELCAGKKVILFAVPGAFTPTCSLKHLPGFIEKADEFKQAGIDTIACIGVNDAFVLDAWGKSVGAGDKVLMLADGSALFTKSIGVELDLTDKGLGVRSRRYSMVVDDMEVKLFNLEKGGAFTLSSAEDILLKL